MTKEEKPDNVDPLTLAAENTHNREPDRMPNDWKNHAVTSSTPLRDCLRVLDQGMQIALVVDDGCHLLGTITDGDVRRALLNGKELDTPVDQVMNRNPVTGLVEEGRALWQRTMQRHGLRHLPLLDAQGCMVDLVRFRLPSEPRRSTPVVLMAGGLGTRLRPLTDKVPKPMLKVGSKPVLETIIENFAAQGFHRIFLCINYMGEMIREHFGDGRRWDVEIQYLEESKRLGTAGALGLLPELPDEPLVVMNGDLLTKVDFVRLLDFHRRQGFIATMAMREYCHQVPYGVLQLGEGYRISQLLEKPVQRHFVNAGIYILNPETLKLIPEDQYYDMTTLFDQLIAGDRPVGSFPLRDYWIDIGRLEDLEQAHNDFAEMFP